MAESVNVAHGMKIMPGGTLFQRYVFLFSLWLLAPGTLGAVLQGTRSHRSLGRSARSLRRGVAFKDSPADDLIEGADEDPASTAQSTAEWASNQKNLAESAKDKAISNTLQAKTLSESESKNFNHFVQGEIRKRAPAALADEDGEWKYMIASFPELRMIQYVILPDYVWRPLQNTGLSNPEYIVVDQERNRLYIADTVLLKIVWYQMLTLADKKLISDGRQHVAVGSIKARSLALDLDGNLWFAGESTPLPPTPSTNAVWKQPLLAIQQATTSGLPADPTPVWTRDQTQSTVSPIVLDAFNIFYGNDQAGTSQGTIVKASKEAPLTDPGSSLTRMADNFDTVYSLVVTPNAVFYGVDGAIYGLPKTKVDSSCGATGDLCQEVTTAVTKPTSMVWNGEGTVYVADNNAGAVYTFASGSVSPHALDKLIDASGVFSLAVYNVNINAAAGLSVFVPLILLMSVVRPAIM
jgi:hypothetical protein